MPAMKFINKLLRINKLVKLRATGSPRELADKLGISERSVYEYIHEMKELGAPIAFSYSHNSYIYYEAGELLIGFSEDIISKKEATIIYGGCHNWIFSGSFNKFSQNIKFNKTAEMLQYQDLALNRFS